MFRPALLLLGLAGGALPAVAAASRGGGEGTATDAASNVAAIKALRGPHEGRIGVSGSVVWYEFRAPYAGRRTARPSRAFRPDGSAKPLLGALAAFLAGTPASRTLRTGSPLRGASCCLPGRPSREE